MFYKPGMCNFLDCRTGFFYYFINSYYIIKQKKPDSNNCRPVNK
jgi:hypothetical protein